MRDKAAIRTAVRRDKTESLLPEGEAPSPRELSA